MISQASLATDVLVSGGLRTKGEIKEGNQSTPFISIITASYNVALTFSRTAKSIRAQTYNNFEWIVVDGGSRDGTVDLIRDNADIISHWVSEKDEGIYDAWNKGVKFARGELICFLGADDCWAAPESLTKLVSARTSDEGIISAQAAIVSQDSKVIRIIGEPWNKSRMSTRQVIAHPGMLFDSRLFEKYGLFDKSYAVAGDYEWLLRLEDDVRAAYINETTVLMRGGGASERKLKAVLAETWAAQRRHVKSNWGMREINFWVYVARVLISMTVRRLFHL